MRAFRADPLSVLGQACAAVLCCSALLRGRSLQTRPEQAPALLLTDTHRGMLSPRGLETSVSLSESLSVCAMQMHKQILAKMYAYRAETAAAASFSTHTHTHMLKHTHSKHIPSQICIFLIPSTLLRLLLLSSPCLSGVIVSILLHQGAPEGYKLNINANALSHCPPPPPSSYTHTPILAIQTDQCVCELIGEQWAFFNE